MHGKKPPKRLLATQTMVFRLLAIDEVRRDLSTLRTLPAAMLLEKRVDTGAIIGLQMNSSGGKTIKVAVEVMRCTSSSKEFAAAGRLVTRMR
ncbi:MAG: hypothetical protein VB878_24075 [Pirellulaceae bacterium]